MCRRLIAACALRLCAIQLARAVGSGVYRLDLATTLKAGSIVSVSCSGPYPAQVWLFRDSTLRSGVWSDADRPSSYAFILADDRPIEWKVSYHAGAQFQAGVMGSAGDGEYMGVQCVWISAEHVHRRSFNVEADAKPVVSVTSIRATAQAHVARSSSRPGSSATTVDPSRLAHSAISAVNTSATVARADAVCVAACRPSLIASAQTQITPITASPAAPSPAASAFEPSRKPAVSTSALVAVLVSGAVLAASIVALVWFIRRGRLSRSQVSGLHRWTTGIRAGPWTSTKASDETTLADKSMIHEVASSVAPSASSRIWIQQSPRPRSVARPNSSQSSDDDDIDLIWRHRPS